MKRWLTTTLWVGVCSTSLLADVKVTSTTTLEGPMAAMMGGLNPTMVTQIKGNKSRTDIQVGEQQFSTIIDAQTSQIILLNPAERTARILTPESVPTGKPGASMPMPKVDASVKPTGQSKVIEGATCDEQAISLTISMAEMAAGSQMPPQAAEMMKDVKVRMDGSAWVAKTGPGVAEYIAFQSASAKHSLSTLTRALPGMGSMGLDRLIESFAGAFRAGVSDRAEDGDRRGRRDGRPAETVRRHEVHQPRHRRLDGAAAGRPLHRAVGLQGNHEIARLKTAVCSPQPSVDV